MKNKLKRLLLFVNMEAKKPNKMGISVENRIGKFSVLPYSYWKLLLNGEPPRQAVEVYRHMFVAPEHSPIFGEIIYS